MYDLLGGGEGGKMMVQQTIINKTSFYSSPQSRYLCSVCVVHVRKGDEGKEWEKDKIQSLTLYFQNDKLNLRVRIIFSLSFSTSVTPSL